MSWWLYRKPNSSKWWAKVKIPGRNPFARTTGTTNKRTAERVAERLEREALVSGAPVTLEEALTAWYRVQVDKGNSPHTLAITERCGGHLCGHLGRFRAIATIELADTTEYMRVRRAFVKDPTIYRELRVLREALQNQKRMGRYARDPALLWPTGLSQTFPSKERWLTAQEWRALYLALPPRWRDALVVMSFTGLRSSEAYALRTAQVNARERRLYAPGTKTETSRRWVPLHAEVQAVAERRRAQKAATMLDLEDGDYQVTRHRLHSALRRAARKARIEHVSANDLRRTFCSWCYQAGVSEADCARWLGHKGSKMVREVYGHDSPENAAKKLDAVPTILVSPTVSPDDASQSGSADT